MRRYREIKRRVRCAALEIRHQLGFSTSRIRIMASVILDIHNQGKAHELSLLPALLVPLFLDIISISLSANRHRNYKRKQKYQQVNRPLHLATSRLAQYEDDFLGRNPAEDLTRIWKSFKTRLVEPLLTLKPTNLTKFQSLLDCIAETWSRSLSASSRQPSGGSSMRWRIHPQRLPSASSCLPALLRSRQAMAECRTRCASWNWFRTAEASNPDLPRNLVYRSKAGYSSPGGRRDARRC